MSTDPHAPTTIVVPTVGRPTLRALLDVLAGQVPQGVEVLVVDDRREPRPLDVPNGLRISVLHSGGRGPAAARNVGWRAASTPWVAFLDDDVLPHDGWFDALLEDIEYAAPDTVATQGHVHVPLPHDRPPTDWERATANLEDAAWITADFCVRRAALSRIGGLDERFRRAYREDTDLVLRLQRGGGRVARGRRHVDHPVRPADFWASVRAQAGNADDRLMRRMHGPHWRVRAGVPTGRLGRHGAIVAATAAGILGAVTGRRGVATTGTAAAVAGMAEFAAARILPGPRDRAEVVRMLATSAAIPFAATAYAGLGWLRHCRAAPWRGTPELVLFDRDGTLVHDVPYNGDPDLVEPVDGAARALAALREAGIRTGLVTNQSGVGRGLITHGDAHSVNARIAKILGSFDVVAMCCHRPEDDCGCRKPAPGLVRDACDSLGITPDRTAVIGDIGADVEAAERAGAVGVLVPNAATRDEERARAARVADDLPTAVRRLLDGTWQDTEDT